MLGVTLWSAEAMRYPGAFNVDLALGYLIVVPVLVVMLFFVVRDLRSRVVLGRLFEDEVARPAPTMLADEPDREQRVADAAGHGAGDGDGPPPVQVGADAL